MIPRDRAVLERAERLGVFGVRRKLVRSQTSAPGSSGTSWFSPYGAD
jgi:hypothetical protein